jgi:tetratricopeptide (TPR) repeat protein
MWNPLISLAAAIIITAVFGLIFSNFWYGIVPGVFGAAIIFVLLVRRTFGQLTVHTNRVQEILTPPKGYDPIAAQRSGRGWTPPFGEAIEELTKATELQKWQFLIVEQIGGQIGQLYYVQKRFEQAQPWLEKAWGRDWMAKAFLGAIHTRRNDLPAARLAFDTAVRHHDKEPLLWNTYAWCLNKLGDDEGALLILDRAHAQVPGDERTTANLENVRNGKKLQMKLFGESWYLFFLEDPPATVVQQGFGPGHQRGFRPGKGQKR